MKLTHTHLPPAPKVFKKAFLKYLYILLQEGASCPRVASHHPGGRQNYRGSGEGQRKKAPSSNREYFHFNITGSEQRSEQANKIFFFFF